MGGNNSKINETAERQRREQEAANNSRINDLQSQVNKHETAERQRREREEAKTKEVLDKPWRTLSQFDWQATTLEQMKADISACQFPSEAEMDTANILIVGQVGGGKSSLINTVASAFNTRLVKKSDTGTAEKSLTKKLVRTLVRDETGQEIKLRFFDTMGLEVDQQEGLNIDTIEKIMDGFVPHNTNLENNLESAKQSGKLRQQPELKDKMHGLVFVINAEKFSQIDDNIIQKFLKIREAANDRDIPSMVIMTGIDRVCGLVEEDTSNVFHSQNIQKMVNIVSGKSGYSMNMVNPQRNYAIEQEKVEHIDFLTVYHVRQLLYSACDYCQLLADNLVD